MLLGWLQAFYGCQLGDLSSDAPLWVSLATNGTRGKRLSTWAIEQICQDRLGEVHRHCTTGACGFPSENESASWPARFFLFF